MPISPLDENVRTIDSPLSDHSAPQDVQRMLADERILADSPAEAVALSRRAAEEAQQSGDQLALARAHLLCGMALRRLGDLVSAQSVLENAEALLTTLGDTFYLARVYQARAAIHNAAGELDAAINYLVRAHPLAAEHRDIRTLQRILTTWAVAAMRKGDYTASIDRLKEAEASLEEYPDEGLRTVVLNAFGSIYQRSRKFEVALEYFKKSLEVSRSMRSDGRKESRNHSASLICIADTLITLGRTGEAAPYLDEALEIARENELLDVQASVLKAYGDRAMHDEQFDTAIRHYTEASEVLDATGNGMIMITVLNQLAAALMMSGEWQRAEATLTRALDFERKVRSPEHEHATHELLGSLYESLSDFERATRHYKLALESHQRLFSQQNQSVLRG